MIQHRFFTRRKNGNPKADSHSLQKTYDIPRSLDLVKVQRNSQSENQSQGKENFDSLSGFRASDPSEAHSSSSIKL